MKIFHGKSFLITVITSITLYAVIVGFMMYVLYSTEKRDILDIGDKTVSNVSANINGYIDKNINILAIESSTIDSMMQTGVSNEEIQRYMTIATNSYISNIDESFSGFYGVFNGEYLDGSGWNPGEGYIPEERPWYITAIGANGNTAVSAPYVDKMTGNVMISICRLLSDGKSVISMDIGLNEVDNITNFVHIDGYIDCLIVNSDGLVISSSLGDTGMNYLLKEAGEDKEQLFLSTIKNSDSSFETEFNGNRKTIFTKTNFGDWHTILIVDSSTLYKDAYQNIGISIIASLALIALLLFFCYYSNRKRVTSETSLNQIKAISGIYVTVASINLKDDTYEVLSNSDHIKKIADSLKNNTSASKILEYIMNSTVEEEYLPSVLKFIDLDTIISRLGKSNTISHEFRGKFTGWCRERFIVVDYDKNQKPWHIIFAVENINQQRIEAEQYKADSIVDELTGCLNRRAFDEAVNGYRNNKLEDKLVCFSIDVNELKAVNDDLGHAAGDEIIKATSEAMKHCLRPYGKIYRIGGDEFFAFIEVDESTLSNVILDLMNEVNNWKGNLVDKVSISAGFSRVIGNENKTIDELIEIADKNMYEDKERYYLNKGIDRRSQIEAFSAISSSYEKLLLVNLTFDTFRIINLNQEEKTPEKGYRETISAWLKEFALSGQIHEEDRDFFIEKTEINSLREYFDDGNKSFSIYYRRLIKGEFHKVLMEIIPTSNYTKDNQRVYLYVKTIK